MTTPHFTLLGFDTAIVPEDTPSYGEGEISYLYATEKEDGSPYLCFFNFHAEEDIHTHKQQLLEIKDAAAAACGRHQASGNRQPNLEFWRHFLDLVRQFKNTWGADRVPKDIRVATTDVELNHHIQLTFQD